MTLDTDRALAAHRRILDTAAAMPGQIDMGQEPVGHWVPLAPFSRLLHLGEAIQRLVGQGFGDASEPPARAMVSASISIVAIIDGDSDGRALAFLAETIKVRGKRLRALVEHGLMDQAAADAHEAAAVANDQAVLSEYATKGVVPTKLGSGPTWHGLTDHDLFDKMNAASWYDLFYAPFSDEAHANAAAIGPEITALRNGGGIETGPRDGDHIVVLLGSVQTICQALRQLDGQRGWGKRDDIDQMFQWARAELEAAAGIGAGG